MIRATGFGHYQANIERITGPIKCALIPLDL